MSHDINREVSWLHFNARVLQEAEDKNNPLLERLRFLGIYSNNNDEFFRVRVAVLTRLIRINETASSERKKFKDYNVEDVYARVMEMQHQQQIRFRAVWASVQHELAENNIFFVDEKMITADQAHFVRGYFRKNIRPGLYPVMLSKLNGSEFLHDNAVYLAVDLYSSQKQLKERYALIEIPVDKMGRFLVLPSADSAHYVMFLDDVIRYCLDDLFGMFGYDRFSAYTIKITRDAELDIDQDISRSFMELMEMSVKRRAQGDPVRFVYDQSMPEKLLLTFSEKLRLTKKANFFPGGRYHNFRDLMAFPKLGSAEMSYEKLPPVHTAEFPDVGSIINVIREKDVLLHYPYHSFESFIDLLREASLDPKVRSLKVTLYRVAKDSNVINALINAARNGKQVTVFFEFQARFDEENNIYYTNILQEEGVRVISSIPGYKVHSKLLLIRRKEAGLNKYYAAIGTGNFNESTAKVYTDLMLFTSNENITNEVNQVFHLFDNRFMRPEFKHLIVSPFSHRAFINSMIDREVQNAKSGLEAWVDIKLNNLVDQKVIEKIREAASAGVKFRMLIRGICVMVPTKKDLKNIEIISVVGRFLEHSRFLIFANGGNVECYLSSADWMKRNLDHRIEVSCPVYDKNHIKTLREVFEISWKDNVKARYQDGTEENRYRKNRLPEPWLSQQELYRYFAEHQ